MKLYFSKAGETVGACKENPGQGGSRGGGQGGGARQCGRDPGEDREEEARGSKAGRRALACRGGEPVATAGFPS